MEMCTKDQPKEYIERGAAINAISGQPSELHYPSWYKGNIEGVPAADVVEVVRCKDCKFAKMLIDIIGDPHLFCCHGSSINRRKVDLEDYCSNGAKMDGGKHETD